MTIRTVAEMAIECCTPWERVATGDKCRTDRSLR